MAVTKRRKGEVAELLQIITAWATRSPDIQAVALVGSWARNTPDAGSDVDLVVLTRTPESYVQNDAWLADVVPGQVDRRQSWGAIIERRVRSSSGLEVEFGIGDPSWAGTSPVDAGTRRVITDGVVVLFDPHGLLGRLLEACALDP